MPAGVEGVCGPDALGPAREVERVAMLGIDGLPDVIDRHLGVEDQTVEIEDDELHGPAILLWPLQRPLPHRPTSDLVPAGGNAAGPGLRATMLARSRAGAWIPSMPSSLARAPAASSPPASSNEPCWLSASWRPDAGSGVGRGPTATPSAFPSIAAARGCTPPITIPGWSTRASTGSPSSRARPTGSSGSAERA